MENQNGEFNDALRSYINQGDRVAELYHGDRVDILKNLSEVVGQSGQVYGVDQLNPFEDSPNMKELERHQNIRLVKSKVPPLPSEVSDLDAIVIREFVWTLPRPATGGVNQETYNAIRNSIKDNGYLILHLNETEQRTEAKGRFYQKLVERCMPEFENVQDENDVMVFQKR